MNETQNINLILSGKTDIFRLLVEKYQNMLFDLALRFTKNIQESEDLVQASFIKIYKNLKYYNPKYKFSNWVYTIALNTIKNHLRRRKIIKFLSLDFKPKGQHFSFETKENFPAPDKQMEQREFNLNLQNFIYALPFKLKEIFILYYLHEKSISEISAISKLTENAIKLRLMRARNIIYDKLKSKFPQYLKEA